MITKCCADTRQSVAYVRHSQSVESQQPPRHLLVTLYFVTSVIILKKETQRGNDRK